ILFTAYFFGVMSFGIGIIFVLFLIIYLIISYMSGRSTDVVIEHRPLTIAIVVTLLSIVGLQVGSYITVESSVLIAESFNISPFLIAITLLAIGTSLPELIVTAIAVLQKENHIAVGNIIGSNIFN